MKFSFRSQTFQKESAAPTVPFLRLLSKLYIMCCAPIPEQYRWPLLPYQDPPGVGMRKTRELHGFEACPVSYRCHPGPPQPSVTPIRITSWIRPAPIIVRHTPSSSSSLLTRHDRLKISRLVNLKTILTKNRIRERMLF